MFLKVPTQFLNMKPRPDWTGPEKLKPEPEVKTWTGFLFETWTRPDQKNHPPRPEGKTSARKNKTWTRTGPDRNIPVKSPATPETTLRPSRKRLLSVLESRRQDGAFTLAFYSSITACALLQHVAYQINHPVKNR